MNESQQQKTIEQIAKGSITPIQIKYSFYGHTETLAMIEAFQAGVKFWKEIEHGRE